MEIRRSSFYPPVPAGPDQQQGTHIRLNQQTRSRSYDAAAGENTLINNQQRQTLLSAPATQANTTTNPRRVSLTAQTVPAHVISRSQPATREGFASRQAIMAYQDVAQLGGGDERVKLLNRIDTTA